MTPVEPPRKSRKKWWILGIIAVVLVILILPLMMRSPDRAAAARKAPETAAVARGTIQRRIDLDGSIQPKASYSLTFPVPASDVVVGPTIRSIDVSIGDQVSEGQILAQLEGDDVDSARITAPVAGVITSIPGAAGAPPPPGAVLTMRTNSLQGRFLVGESDLTAMSAGLDASVTIPVLSVNVATTIATLPTDPEVAALSTAAPSTSVNYALLVPLPEIQNLRPGLTARLTTIAQKHENVLLVKSTAIGGDPASPSVEVWVAGRSETRPIRTGVTDGREVEIVEGLNEGDLVLLRPAGGSE